MSPHVFSSPPNGYQNPMNPLPFVTGVTRKVIDRDILRRWTWMINGRESKAQTNQFFELQNILYNFPVMNLGRSYLSNKRIWNLEQ